MRLCLGVEVCGGKEHAARRVLPGLWSLRDALPRTHWPAFIRSDCAYGNEPLLAQAEAQQWRAFSKLRHTAKVKVLVAQMQRAGSRWRAAGDGWEVLESSLCLIGWSRDSSRPALLSGVGRLLRHGGQRRVKVSLQHEKATVIAEAIRVVSNTLARVNAVAEQWTIEQRWTLLLTHILRHWLCG